MTPTRVRPYWIAVVTVIHCYVQKRSLGHLHSFCLQEKIESTRHLLQVLGSDTHNDYGLATGDR